MGQSTPHRRDHVEIDHDRVLDDELEVEPTEAALPDHLDRPLEVPEADAVEQQIDTPLDEDRR
jgi:hypothetical protein